MAKRYMGLSLGSHTEDVSAGSSTQSKDVEVVIDLSVTTLTKSDALIKIDEIKNYIIKQNWPLA